VAAAAAAASRYKWAEIVGVPAANGRTRPRLACVVVAFPRHPTARKPQLNRGARDTPHRGGAPLPPPPPPTTTPPPPATTTTTTTLGPPTLCVIRGGARHRKWRRAGVARSTIDILHFTALGGDAV